MTRINQRGSPQFTRATRHGCNRNTSIDFVRRLLPLNEPCRRRRSRVPRSVGRRATRTLHSSFRRQHQLDDFFRDLWLEAFGMPFVEPNHIGNDVPFAAFRIHEHRRFAGPRLEALRPTSFGRPKTRVPDVPGFRVDDSDRMDSRGTTRDWTSAGRHSRCGRSARAGSCPFDSGEAEAKYTSHQRQERRRVPPCRRDPR